jgi:hypothetical protein
MYIILTKNQYNQYEVINDYLSKPKIFKNWLDAVNYTRVKKIESPYQLIGIKF